MTTFASRLGGLRLRLVVLLLLAVLPVIILATYAAMETRQDAVQRVQEQAQRAAESLGTTVDLYITQSRQVLFVISVAPILRHGGPDEIGAFLEDVHTQNQELSTLLVTRLDGRVSASASSLAGNTDLSDQDYWKDIQQTHAFSIGSYSIGRISEEPTLTMSQPILADDGSLLGAVVAGINLESFGSFIGSADLLDEASFCVVDRNGIVLMRYPDPQTWIGKNIGGSAFGRLMLEGEAGSSEIPGMDGVTRLYSFAPVLEAQRGVFVAVGVPRSVAYTSVSDIVNSFVAGMVLVVLLVTVAAWMGADTLVLRPIGRLVKAVQGLGSGDLSVRVGAEWGSDEISQLAQVFDSMAGTIENRTASAEQSEARYRALVESSPNGVIVHQDGRIVFANEAAARIGGASATADLVGRHVMELVHPDSLELARRHFEEAYRTGEATDLAEERLLRLDGSEVDVEVMSIPLVFGETIAMSTIIRDISDRKLAEQGLRENRERNQGTQRLEAVGRLAGGVAHDFNNLLTAIIGYAEIGQARSEGDTVLDEVFGEIRTSADRAAALTRQLLAFSRQQPLRPRVVDLNAVTESISGFLRQLIGEDVQVALNCTRDLWPVEVDPGQIEQLIANLAINARDAMPGGGKLTIQTANVELGDDYAGTHLESQPGPHVMLAVSDTGIGIDVDTLPRIFEPFFTTKERGKGNGLGLSTVYGIVKQSGGSIYVYSEPGQGTAFKIYFPRVDRPVDWTPASVPTQEDRAKGGSETILVVEDEPAVRALAVRVLEGAGYTVLQEGDPTEALKLFNTHSCTIHMLLTDVVLPGMSGKVLADTLAAGQGVHPRVLFMSGYTQNAIVHEGRLNPNVGFLEKPFTLDGLLYKVREILDRPEDQLEMPM